MQQRSEETREKILAAAGVAFARGGYDATGVAEICAAAGVSKGAFYHHFRSKKALFLALLEAWLATIEPSVRAFGEMESDPADRLAGISELFDQIFKSGQGKLPMFLEFWVQSGHDPQVWQATIAPYHRYIGILAETLQHAIDRGALRAADGRSASQTVLALAIGMILQGLFDPTGADWVNVSQEGMKTLINGMIGRAQ